MIKFEKVSRYNNDDLILPQRATENSAGYDFFSPEEVIIPAHGMKIVQTGVKCELLPDLVLILANRSSNPIKKNLVVLNGVGIIDADYYNNESNEGEIGFMLYNFSDEDTIIKKDDKIGQGIITKYIITEDDMTTGRRLGGFGSTGK